MIALPQLTKNTKQLADPVEAFIARCEARAMLFEADEFDLHEAVDVLQDAAVANRLVGVLGQDRVQEVMGNACRLVRQADDGTKVAATSQVDEAPTTPEIEDADDDEYDGLTSSFARLCRAADEEHKCKAIKPR